MMKGHLDCLGGIGMSVNTKNLIVAAFFDLAKVKPLDKITIKDVVEACGITRQTFYYHFQDILDVIEWSLKQYSQPLIEKTLAAKNTRDAFRVMLSILEDNSAVIAHLIQSRKQEQVERLLLASVKGYFEALIPRQTVRSVWALDELETVLNFYSYAVIGVLLENAGRKNVDLDRLADQLDRLARGAYFSKLVESLE